MHKISLWVGISSFCFSINSTLPGVEMVLPSPEILSKISQDLQSHSFSSGDDLIVLTDGRKIRGKINLKKLQDDAALISIEQHDDRDILRIITVEGKQYIDDLPNDKLQILLGNYKKEIELSSIQYILTHKLNDSNSLRSMLYTVQLKDGDLLTVSMFGDKVPKRVFCDATSCAVPKIDKMISQPARVFEDQEQFEQHKYYIITNIPTPLFDSDTSLDVPKETTLAYFPIRIYCDDEKCGTISNVAIHDLPTPLWDTFTVLEVPQNVIIKSEGASLLTLSPQDIPYDHTVKIFPTQLFQDEDIKNDLPQNVTVQLWPVRRWDDEFDRTQAPIIECKSFSTPYFFAATSLGLPDLISFDVEEPENDNFEEQFVLNDIPIGIELKNMPSILFCESDFTTPQNIVCKRYVLPLLSEDITTDIPAGISTQSLPQAYWKEEAEFAIPQDVIVLALPESALCTKTSFGIPKHIIITDIPKPHWTTDASLEIPQEIAMRELPPRHFKDPRLKNKSEHLNISYVAKHGAEVPHNLTTKKTTWREKILSWWNNHFQNKRPIISFDQLAAKKLIKKNIIDIRRVTNAEYREFVNATRHQYPSHWHQGIIPEGMENRAVANVTYSDAAKYAQWKHKRLPTADEWQEAANLERLEGANEFFNEWVISENEAPKGRYYVVQGNTPNHSVRQEREEYNSHTGFRCFEE